jgi:hypothetical protein
MPAVLDTVPYGLTEREWEKINRIWKMQSRPVTLQVRDTAFNGQIVFVNDSVLLFWMNPSSFINPYAADSLLRSFQTDSILQILADGKISKKWWEKGIYRGTILGLGSGIVLVIFVGQGWVPFYFAFVPAIIGTGIGWSVDKVIARKQAQVPMKDKKKISLQEAGSAKYSLFPDSVPELTWVKFQKIRYYDGRKQLAFRKLQHCSPRIASLFSMNASKLSILVDEGFSFSKNYTYNTTVMGLGARYCLPRNNSIEINYSLTLDIVMEFPPFPFRTCNHFLRKDSYSLSWFWSPVVPDWFLTQRFRLSTGVFASVNTLNLDESYYDVPNRSYSGSFFHNQKRTKPGAGFIAELDFYLTRRLSMGIKAEKSFISSMKVNKMYFTLQPSMAVVSVPEEKIDLSSFDLALSLRISL